MTTRWQKNDRLYSETLNVYATVTSIDKYGNGKGVIQIETDGGIIGTGLQSSFENKWRLVDEQSEVGSI